MRIKKPWIMVNAESGSLECDHCGASEPLNLPAAVDAFVTQGEEFAKKHYECPPKKCALKPAAA